MHMAYLFKEVQGQIYSLYEYESHTIPAMLHVLLPLLQHSGNKEVMKVVIKLQTIKADKYTNKLPPELWLPNLDVAAVLEFFGIKYSLFTKVYLSFVTC